MSILILFQSFGIIWAFRHFYKSASSVIWEQNVEIGMIGEKRCEVQMYYTIYSEYTIQYIIYYIQYIL